MKNRSTGKYQYSVKEDRLIYIIHAPHCNDFYIWHCKKDLWKASYARHLCGKRKATADFVSQCLKNGYQPCLHILEVVHLTQVMAYRHVIAWSQILYIADYEPLVGDKTLFYMSEMYGYTQTVYGRHKNADLTQLLSCKTCLVKTCANYQAQRNT